MIACMTAAFLALLAQDWTEHRGGPARSGVVDGKAGPATLKTLWVYRSKEHYLAPISAAGDRIFTVAMGAFNTGSVRVLEAGTGKVVWHKSAPIIRLPTVGTPAAVGGTLIFGEGMHQTDGTSLSGLRVSDGRILWRFELPGELVHLEASPALAGGKAYAGTGNGGVICVDPSKVTLEGKEMPLADAIAAVDRKWKALSDAYEADRKKDPDFAIPPNEATLPRPAPTLAWQKGKGSWHVDAPLLVADGAVYAASAYLDKEKFGERALIRLDAASGAEAWKAPLRYNAWGGATQGPGGLLLVPCSSIRYDPKEIPAAKGEIVALKASDGSAAWRRETAGAALGSVAVAGEVAVHADTSGHVTALDAKSGQPKWSVKTGAPHFGGVAVAGGTVYVADIEGVVHALSLADGKSRGSLDLGKAAAPGMVYGGPVVHGGRLYVATANLEGSAANGETVVVCIGEN
jgi:outer membrane protein assembly factor BamB